jgi:hypothetical protein
MLVIENVRDGWCRRDGAGQSRWGDAHLGDGVPCLDEARVAGGHRRVWWGTALSAVEEHCKKKGAHL